MRTDIDRRPRMRRDRRPQMRRDRRRWMFALAMALTLACGVILGPGGHVPEVQARPQDRHGPHGAVVEAADGTAEMGQFQLGDLVVWCIDLNSWGPQRASGWTQTRTDRIRKQVAFGDREGHTHIAGPLVSRAELAEIAWVLEWAEQNVNDDASAIAVDHVIRLRTVGDAAQETRMTNRLDAATDLYPTVPELVERLEKRAAAEAGPYRLALELEPGEGNGTVQVLGRAGTPLPNRTVRIAIGVDGGESTVDADTGPEGIGTFPLPDVTGEVTVRAAASVPGSIPVVHTPTHYDDENHQDYRVQRMLSAGEHTEVTATDSYRVGGDTPSVVTVTSAATVVAGDEIHDVLRVSGAGSYSGTATATLWGPYDAPPRRHNCRDEDASPGSVTVDVDGDGTYRTPDVRVSEPGHYTWTVTLPPVDGSERVTTPCGVEAETTRVESDVTVTTDVRAGGNSTNKPTVGIDVRDEVHVVGLGEDEPARISATLWGPYDTAPGKDRCQPGDPVAGEVFLEISGDGSHLTPAVRPAEPGHYVWTVEVESDGLDAPVHTPCGDPRETIRLEAASEPTPSVPDTRIDPPIPPRLLTPTAATPGSPSPPGPDSKVPDTPTAVPPTPWASESSVPGHSESPRPTATPALPRPSDSVLPRPGDSPFNPTPRSPQPPDAPEPATSPVPGPSPEPAWPTRTPEPWPEPDAPIRIPSGA